MEDLPPDETNEKAEEGTACGELFTAMLLQRTTTPQIGKIAANGVLFDDDMWFYCGEIAIKILGESESRIFSEERIDWNTASGIKVRGQYDASYTIPKTLCIDDLKYGYGIVEVKENWQLLGYAIGEVQRRYALFRETFEFIRLTIHQPRPHHEDGETRSWTISYGHLLELKEKIDKRLMVISQGDTELQTGKHCKYCEAAGSCAALNKAAYNAVDIAMNPMVQDHLSDEQLSKELDMMDRATELLKIRKDSITQLVVNRIRAGGIILNYSIEEKYGHRTWKKSITAESLKLLTGQDPSKPGLMTPAQFEKKGISKDFIAGMVERPFKGVKVKRVDTNAMANKIFGGQ